MSLLNKVFGKPEEEKKSAVKKTDKVKVVAKAEAKESKQVVKAEEKKVESKPTAKKSDLQRDDVKAYKLLLKPVITEKATDLAAMNKYVFAVPVSATKSEVSKKIKNVFGVKAIKINMIKKSGKNVRYGRRAGRTKNWKKAIVTLAEGDKIEIYEGV